MQVTPGGPDAAAAAFPEVEVEVPPGVPLAKADGPPAFVAHSPFGALAGTVTANSMPSVQSVPDWEVR